MNVHHLELFYHVAKHGGISEAVRKMPYGIQQPAVSSQILQLEGDLGLKLFQRRPFTLTPAGRELFAFVEPFFGNVEKTGARLRGEIAQRLRLAAPGTILRDHLPKQLEQLRRVFPRLRLTLRDANQEMAENLLRKQEVDLAITEMEGRPSSGIQCCELLSLPLHLLVPETHSVRSPADLWKEKEIGDPLICMPPNETITKLFRQGLRKLAINWPTTVELSSLDLIPSYVRARFGIAISVAAPGESPPVKIRQMPLKNFPPLVIAALWQGKLPPIAEAFLQQIKAHAHHLKKRSR